MAKKKVQAVSFDDLKKLVVNEAKNNNNVLTQEQIDEYLMNYDLSDELTEELLEYIQQNQITISDDDLDSLDVDDDMLLAVFKRQYLISQIRCSLINCYTNIFYLHSPFC